MCSLLKSFNMSSASVEGYFEYNWTFKQIITQLEGALEYTNCISA